MIKKHIFILGIICFLFLTGLSGCFETDDKHLFNGNWNNDGTWLSLPLVIVFNSTGKFKISFKTGNHTILFSNGTWVINEGILTMEMPDVLSLTNYTYQFSENNRILTLTDLKNNHRYVLSKE